MFSKKNLQHITIIFLIFIIQFSTLTNKSLAQNSSAYNDVRNTTGKDCNEQVVKEGEEENHTKVCYESDYDENTEMCKTISEFKFDPYGENVDRDWNFGNAHCLSFIYGPGMLLEGAFYYCDIQCPGLGTAMQGPKEAAKTLFKNKFGELAGKVASGAAAVGNAGVSTTGSALIGMPINPLHLASLAYYSTACAQAVYSGGTLPCCFSAGICGGALATAVSALAAIWDVAKDNFYTTTICGAGWKAWKRDSDEAEWKTLAGNYAICLNTIFGKSIYCAPGVKDSQSDKKCKEGPKKEPDCSVSAKNKSQSQYCKFTNYQDECNVQNVDFNKDVSFTNIYYREFFFQGIEYKDNGSNACMNPDGDKWETILGYQGGPQRYYFKGPNQIPNFACNRFLQLGPKDKDGLEAFACCQKNSQKTICLERFDDTNKDHKFCRIGQECQTNLNKASLPVKYKIFESETSKNHICAQTYTVCPYDHNVQGGTDKKKHYYYNPKIVTNFCQYMNHCIKVAPISEYPYFNPDTFFFSGSCKDLRGDSQFFNENEIGRSSKSSSMYSRNFSAPMVQCFKETLENNFMQKVGQTICKDLEETPQKTKANPEGICLSGEYMQRKGDVLNQTFFVKVQKRFLIPIKIALVLSVAMFGFNILLATPESFIDKKSVMTYLVKFGLVYFFVVGNAWQGFFMDSVMNLSSEFANITFSPKSTTDDSNIGDGCDFPKYNHLSLLDESIQNPKADRKTTIASIKKNPSYPPGKNYLRIWDTLDCKIARAIGYGPNVSTPNLLKMIFAGFISGSLGIMFFFAAFAYGIMLFSIALRAIHITIMSIMGIILLIYVSPLTITCALFERTKGIFENWWKQMLGFILQPMILFAYLGLMLTVFDDLFIGDAKFKTPVNGELSEIDCNPDVTKKTNPEENSIYCILQLDRYKNYSGLEVFDLAIPVLMSMTKEKINTLTRAAIIMFVFLKFLDTITTVAKKLVGGAELKAESTTNIQNLLKKVAKGVQKRALNTTKRLATSVLPEVAKGAIRSKDKVTPKSEGGGEKSSSSDAVGGSSP